MPPLALRRSLALVVLVLAAFPAVAADVGTLWRLANAGAIGRHVVTEAIRQLGVDPEKIDAALA